MLVFWKKITLPLLNWAKPQKIIEVGAQKGQNTLELLKYCQAAGAELFVIDPFPLFNVLEYKGLFHKQFHMLQDFSLEVLPYLLDYDFVLLDGDHNWYTVYHELKTIEAMSLRTGNFPIVMLHDTAWPYGRRDMYYFPESIPPAYRHPYAQKGMTPGQSSLAEIGGTNQILYNAAYEYGKQNGVLTAIEDFMKETKLELCFHQIKSYHGLGIIYPNLPKHASFIPRVLTSSGL